VLIRNLFEHGAFTLENSLATAQVLAGYIPGLLFALLGVLAIRAHIVERNLRIVFILGAASVVSNFILNQLLVGRLGLPGLAISTTINDVLITTIYVLCLVHLLPKNMLRRWGWGFLIAGASALLALFMEMGPGIPQSLSDVRLWMAAVMCSGLLVFAVGLIRTERMTSS